VDSAGVDVILVGDSVATVVQGHETTIPVSLDEMIYHCRCVTRGVERALVVGDLPFLSYQQSVSDAITSAGRLLKEGGVGAVKLEGGRHMAETVQAISAVDIPVMGHIGLTPQSFHRMGGHRVQGKSHRRGKLHGVRSDRQIVEDAQVLEDAGAFAIVLEGVPQELAAEITSELSIPTIGIGAGPQCDGQILVVNDLLGMQGWVPKFVKKYADLENVIGNAIGEYVEEVQKGVFPAPEHCYSSPKEELPVRVVK
jgi:3-methyl-2-oxobutanoate hydroxymethyltransferase